MSSIIQRITRRFFSTDQGYTVTILGLDNSGKTTLLYVLRLGEIVQTIPTIGFNVETVEVTTSRGVLSFTGWDIGGCSPSHLHGMMSIYAANGDGIVWMVDSGDHSRIPPSIQELSIILAMTLKRRAETDKAQTPLPVLVLANKQDRPYAVSVDEIRMKFWKALSGHMISRLPEAFSWLSVALDAVRKPQSTASPPQEEGPVHNPRSSDPLLQKVSDWIVRADADSTPDEFLSQFQKLQPPAWDHYTHIRIAFVILTIYGRQKGKDMIFAGIQKYIAESSQAGGRTFHVTMTYFWIQIIHFGIVSMTAPFNTSQAAGQAKTPYLRPPPTSADFPKFLVYSPHVADGNLWSQFYSKELMMSPDAKVAMVLSDKKSLPSVVNRDAPKAS